MVRRNELTVGARFADQTGDVWEILSIDDNDQTLRAEIVEARPKHWTINRAQAEWDAVEADEDESDNENDWAKWRLGFGKEISKASIALTVYDIDAEHDALIGLLAAWDAE